MEEQAIKTYRALKIQRIGDDYRPIGELVPEAATWLRVDEHVGSRYLAETIVTKAEYSAAVLKYCPHLAGSLGVTLPKAKPVLIREK